MKKLMTDPSSDVETLKAEVARLEQASQNQLDFLSTVSHELRTPVANMKMAVKMLELSLSQIDASLPIAARPYYVCAMRYLNILSNECGRETDLINDLLDLQRLEAGAESLMKEPIDLQTWLPELVVPFQERAQNNGQTFLLYLPVTLPPLFTNSLALKRILAELLNNACKYTPALEEISLVVLANEGMMRLSVRNSGIEIPSSELPHIFDKFYRASGTKKTANGSGLGLALAQKLTQCLGGILIVRSDALVTCFTVELPLQNNYVNIA